MRSLRLVKSWLGGQEPSTVFTLEKFKKKFADKITTVWCNNDEETMSIEMSAELQFNMFFPERDIKKKFTDKVSDNKEDFADNSSDIKKFADSVINTTFWYNSDEEQRSSEMSA